MRLALLLFFATGCAALPNTQVVKLDGHQVELAQVDGQRPVVVFESGLGGQLEWWAGVFPTVSKRHAAFVRNRPGLGRSESTGDARDGVTTVEQLRSLLRARNLEPPYVLVGHSLGGLYLQLFARAHPEEVAGLVLVDSTHPEQQEGAGAVENWPTAARQELANAPAAVRAELDAVSETGRQMLALPPFSSARVIILSAQQPMSDMSTELARHSNALRERLPELWPGAEVRWVDSGHGIPLEAPDAVIRAVEDLTAP